MIFSAYTDNCAEKLLALRIVLGSLQLVPFERLSGK